MRTPTIRGGVVVPDGVSASPCEPVSPFIRSRSGAEHEAIGHAIELRVLRWLRRKGQLDADDPDDPPPEEESLATV